MCALGLDVAPERTFCSNACGTALFPHAREWWGHRMDKLTGMAVFARVVEAQSFTTAAAQLGMSRSAVSKAIAGLEDRLGARLLNRTTLPFRTTFVTLLGILPIIPGFILAMGWIMLLDERIGLINNIVASMLLRRPDVVRGAALLKPMIPFQPDEEPHLVGKPVFIAAGRRDELVPADDTEKLVALLERTGADVTAHWSDAGHQLTDDEIHAAQAWLAEVLARTA
jgi:pimeloyl-ACP methyl ester carboxylesterase